MDAFQRLIAELTARGVRFVVIGVAGINYYAAGPGALFTTDDRDLFLPPDPENVLRAWQACNERDLQVNLTLVMGGFEFEAVWNERRTFMVDSTEIPVARLSHIVQSKAAAGREKDRLFLATHADTLKQLLGRGD